MSVTLSVDAAIGLGVAGVLLALIAAVVILARQKFRDAAATETDLDDFALDLASRTSILLFVPIALHLGTRNMPLPGEVAKILDGAARLALVAQGAFWAVGVVDYALRRYRRVRFGDDPSAVTTVRAFRLVAVLAVWAVALLVGLDNFGFDITALVTGLGIGGVAVALATQNILGDLFASLSIVLDKPFVVGDFIIVGDDLGTVENIGLKTTRVRSLSGEQLVFSNTDLVQSRIRNFKRMAERRVVFRIGVVYRTPAAKLREIPQIVRAIIEKSPNVRFDRAHFASFGASSLDFEFVYYVLSADYNVYMDIHHQINVAIVEAFESQQIEFAFPTRTILLRPPPDSREDPDV